MTHRGSKGLKTGWLSRTTADPGERHLPDERSLRRNFAAYGVFLTMLGWYGTKLLEIDRWLLPFLLPTVVVAAAVLAVGLDGNKIVGRIAAVGAIFLVVLALATTGSAIIRDVLHWLL